MKHLACRLLAVLLLLLVGAIAHPNELDDLKVQQDWDEMLILTASGVPRGTVQPKAAPCEPHWTDVVNGFPVRKCGIDPIYTESVFDAAELK